MKGLFIINQELIKIDAKGRVGRLMEDGKYHWTDVRIYDPIIRAKFSEMMYCTAP